jgi:hypothetical protein
MVADLEKSVPDSILIMWGAVKNLRIAPGRANLITAVIKGELNVTVMVYNLIRKSFSYRINVSSTTQSAKGWIFFSDPNKTIIISASERVKITEKLIDDAANKLTSIMMSIIRNEELQGQTAPASEEGEINKVPSISDVFTVPSVQAAEIQDNTFEAETESEITEETIEPEPDETSEPEPEEAPQPEPDETAVPEDQDTLTE